MAEIGKLVEVVFDDKASSDLSQRLRSDSSLKLGLEKFYSILKLAVEAVGVNGELGFQGWEQSQVHAIGSLACAIACATRSLSVEQAEPIIIAVVQQSLEFAICYLEKSVCGSDELTVQNVMVQILEITLIGAMCKESDILQACFVKTHLDSLLPFTAGITNFDLVDHVRCMFQGGKCSKEEKLVDRLLVTLAAECMQPGNMTQQIVGSASHHDVNKLASLSQHWAVAHLKCVQRLILLCKGLLKLPDIIDDKMVSTNSCKRVSFCSRIFKLLIILVKGVPFVEYDAALLEEVASFADSLPGLFRTEFDFVNSNAAGESSIESLTLLLLEEFLLLVQVVFCNNSVFQNIRACITASVMGNFDTNTWSYSSKHAASQRLPLAYFPRVVGYMLKLILDIKEQTHHTIDREESEMECFGSCIDFQSNSAACHVNSDKILLLKKHTVQELLRIVFPSSSQWLGNLMHLVLFLHSEGVKLRPNLERSHSIGTKTTCTAELESTISHEEEALFGDLFSEGGRSLGSTDAYDQPTIAVPVSDFYNFPIQAATELLTFLKTCIFSPDWHPSIYEDGCKKLNVSHMDILLSIINCPYRCVIT